MLKELRDFIIFESFYGLKVLLNDLVRVNKVFFQDYYLNNILKFARKRNLKFTFFISAKNLHKRKGLVNRIIREGHEIASHGYHHLLLNKLSSKDLEKEFRMAYNEFKKYDINVKGFRAPFLSLSQNALKLLKRYNFTYSSNKMGGNSFSYKNGIREAPIVKPYDWFGLVIEKQKINELIEHWKQRDGCCYLFHPWIINKHFNKIVGFLGKNKDYRIISNLKNNKPSVSFDVY